MKKRIIGLIALFPIMLFAGTEQNKTATDSSLILSRLIDQSEIIVRGTLAEGVMGEVEKGNSIHFVYVEILEVLKKPLQKQLHPYNKLTPTNKIQVLWHSKEDGNQEDKIVIPFKVKEIGIYFLKVQDGHFINTDRWFSYHPDNSKLIEEIRRHLTMP